MTPRSALLLLLSAALPAGAAAAPHQIPDRVELEALAAAYRAVEDGRYRDAKSAYDALGRDRAAAAESRAAARLGDLYAAIVEAARGDGGRHGQGLKIAITSVERARRRGALPGPHVDHALYVAKAMIEDPDGTALADRRAAEEAEPELARLDALRPVAPEPPARRAPRAADPAPAAEPDTPVDRNYRVEATVPAPRFTQRAVNIRSEPWTGNNRIGTLQAGTSVTLIGQVPGGPWVQVKVNGMTAFLHGGYLGMTPPVARAGPQGDAQALDRAQGVVGPAPAPVEQVEPVEEPVSPSAEVETDNGWSPYGASGRGGDGGGGGI